MKSPLHKALKLGLLSIALPLIVNNIAHAGGEHAHHHVKETHSKKAREHTGHNHTGHSSAVGVPALASTANKTIHVTMLDSMKYEFEPALHIHANEVIRFVVSNQGKIVHEFSIGDAEEQRKHAEMMRKMPDMQHKDGNTLSLKPGESGEIIWRFQGATDVVFACNVPGHFEAGMFSNIRVKHKH